MSSERPRQRTAAEVRKAAAADETTPTDRHASAAPDVAPDPRRHGATLDLGEPERALPSLLTRVGADDPATARDAGHSLVLLAREHEGTAIIEQVTGGLVDRLVGGDAGEALLRTLASIDAQDETAVQRPLVETLGRDRARQVYRAVEGAEPWSLPPSLERDLDDEASARTAYATDFRQVVRPDPDASDPAEADPETETIRRRASGEPSPEETPQSAGAEPSQTGSHGGNRPARLGESGRRTPEADDATAAAGAERVASSQLFTAIRLRSTVEELQPLGPPQRRRFGRVVRARGVVDGEEMGVALRLFDRPEAGKAAFEGALAEGLADWERLRDEAGVVEVLDWGEAPRPWVATPYVADTLSGRADRPPVETALDQARRLTGALARAHANDTWLGGLDPRSVVFAADALEPGRRPMLDNVGVVPAVLGRREAASVLDPAYLAPEHLGAGGGVDHATDVYCLGLTLYRLCTGRAPFAGRELAVQEAIASERPRPPSDVVPELPAALDEIIARATAKRKLTRYETATRFHRDLRRVHERILG